MTHNFPRTPRKLYVQNVLVLDYRPAGLPAHWAVTKDLCMQYIAAIRRASHEQVLYRVVETVTLREYPVVEDGRQFTPATYPQALADDRLAFRKPDGNYATVDYRKLVEDHRLAELVNRGDVDEVWSFGGPLFGFYESRMIGANATWCNAPALEYPCRRFVFMGFNYERTVREMVHDFGHRAESMLSTRFSSNYCRLLYQDPAHVPPTPKNAWEQWLLDHGTVHRVPGGEDYSQNEFDWLADLELSWWRHTLSEARHGRV